jgi:hypothetical protein
MEEILFSEPNVDTYGDEFDNQRKVLADTLHAEKQAVDHGSSTPPRR